MARHSVKTVLQRNKQARTSGSTSVSSTDHSSHQTIAGGVPVPSYLLLRLRILRAQVVIVSVSLLLVFASTGADAWSTNQNKNTNTIRNNSMFRVSSAGARWKGAPKMQRATAMAFPLRGKTTPRYMHTPRIGSASTIPVSFTTTTAATTTTALRRRFPTRLLSTIPILNHQPVVDDFKNSNDAHLIDTSVTSGAKFANLKSRPVPGGNWDPDRPLDWAKDFGMRSKDDQDRLEPLIRLSPGDEGYFDYSEYSLPEGLPVTMVRNRKQAKIVVQALMNADPSIFHACDTEVMDIQLKLVGPVTHGYVTCASIYSGPDFDYGLGDGPGTALWIDNLDDACGVLEEFQAWFEDDRFLKVWHNYGFDRHVMWNEGINVKGFGGDTMHMARLQDTSRGFFGGGFSLEALTDSILNRRKKPMKEIFGIKRLRKDGTEGALVDIPPVEVMQRDPEYRTKWIMYSCYDAEGTWLLREALQKELEKMKWIQDGDSHRNLYEYYQMHMRPFGELLTDMERRGIYADTNYLADIEVKAREERIYHAAQFRKWASSIIGPAGLALNLGSSAQLGTFLFGGAENQKTNELTETVRTFKVPRAEISDEAMAAYRAKEAEEKGASAEVGEVPGDYLDHLKNEDLKKLCKEYNLKVSGKKVDLQERLRGHLLSKNDVKTLSPEDDLESLSEIELREACAARGVDDSGNRKKLLTRLKGDTAFALELISASTPKDNDGFKTIADALEAGALDGSIVKDILDEVKIKAQAEPKWVEVTVTSIGMPPNKYTVGGAPSCTADVLRGLAGEPLGDEPKYGSAYDFYGGGETGHNACVALFSLCSIGSIDTMITNFLIPLQSLADSKKRVHCSLNLNTETGRLSSRKPNLQNQPALEKDKYKIRASFQASKGNNLIVADYGQLELRLLASMTRCKSMIDAFEAGGDFHSRTALDMFDYIQKSVDDGECLLEWDYSKGDPPKPLLKDLFASERRKAKTLNFSIAYGKTAHGLSQDWGVSLDEATDMVSAWYKARPEVEKWQADTKRFAKKHGITRTLMGRYRQLPHAVGRDRRLLGGALRASINTPIQGGAADVAMMAMIKINDSETLKRLGWILLLQIHDEVILEGPDETAEEAFAEVIQCMENPWVLGLQETAVPLLVDGSYVHNNWYDAK